VLARDDKDVMCTTQSDSAPRPPVRRSKRHARTGLRILGVTCRLGASGIPFREFDWTLSERARAGDRRVWISDLSVFRARLSNLEHRARTRGQLAENPRAVLGSLEGHAVLRLRESLAQLNAVRVLMLGKVWFPSQLGGLNRYYRSLLEQLPEARGVVVGRRGRGPASDCRVGPFGLYACTPSLGDRAGGAGKDV